MWEELEAVGLLSMGACGDNTRTMTGCPVGGFEHDDLIDATPLVLELDRTGCSHWCTYPEINDVGLTAARRSACPPSNYVNSPN